MMIPWTSCGQLHAWRDPHRFVLVYQHGDNPEARLEIGDHELLQSDTVLFARLAEWHRRVHEYEAVDAVAVSSAY